MEERVPEADEVNSRWQRRRKMQSKQLRLWQKVARGVRDSIKPGVKRSGTPGSRHEPINRARGVGDSPFKETPTLHLKRSVIHQGLSHASRAQRRMCGLILGFASLHPRLYADMRSAHSFVTRVRRVGASPRSGLVWFIWLSPGVSLAALASPQALCCRPLRGLFP